MESADKDFKTPVVHVFKKTEEKENCIKEIEYLKLENKMSGIEKPVDGFNGISDTAGLWVKEQSER